MPKKTLRSELRHYQNSLNYLIDFLEEAGYFCPYSRHPNAIGEEIYEYDDKNDEFVLPDYCSLKGTKDYFGEYDEDCSGSNDNHSCWKHYLGLVEKRKVKFKPKRRARDLKIDLSMIKLT